MNSIKCHKKFRDREVGNYAGIIDAIKVFFFITLISFDGAKHHWLEVLNIILVHRKLAAAAAHLIVCVIRLFVLL